MPWFRLLTLFATVSASIVVLAPTFCQACELPILGHEHRLRLGTDLQGGTDLLLEVEIEEYIREEVRRDVWHLLQKSEESGLSIEEIRQADWAGIEIVSGAETRDVVRFVEQSVGSYQYEGSEYGVHRFNLSQHWQTTYRNIANRNSVEILQRRLEAWCVEGAAIEPQGDRYIFLSMPGEVDESACDSTK